MFKKVVVVVVNYAIISRYYLFPLLHSILFSSFVFLFFLYNSWMCIDVWCGACACVVSVIVIVIVIAKRCSPDCKPLSRLQTSRSMWLFCRIQLNVNSWTYPNPTEWRLGLNRVHTHSLLRHWARRSDNRPWSCVSEPNVMPLHQVCCPLLQRGEV